MAASLIDQKILGRICQQTAISNPLLSSALYQLLGLSMQLSQKLFRAQKIRRLDISRDAKSITLYHHIIWLAREGLAITEVFVLPYCQNGEQSRHCRVMAAKLRASFYHVFCLFHNHPPVNSFSPKRASPPQPGKRSHDARTRAAMLRETIPSMASETSYITNPYAAEGPAQTPPPAYPVPPIPTDTPQGHRTSKRQSGSSSNSDRSSGSRADFLMPPLNFIPAATSYFTLAMTLASKLLPGSDPLRLSVGLEYCVFTWDCGKDFKAARDLARQAVRDVYTAPEGMEDTDFDDAATLVQAIAVIAKRTEGSSKTSPRSQNTQAMGRGTPGRTQVSSPSQRSAGRSSSGKASSSRISLRRQQNQQGPRESAQSTLLSPEGETALSGRSTTLVGSPYIGVDDANHTSSSSGSASAQQSKASNMGAPKLELPRKVSDKERKRRVLERAEEQVERRNSARSPRSADSRQATHHK